MSETTIMQLEKKRNELETELSSKTQKEVTLEKELETLEEELAAQLQEKIKAKNADLERLESKKSVLERRLTELREPANASPRPEETLVKAAEPKEQLAGSIEATVVIDQRPHLNDEIKEKQKEDKKRKWI